MKDNRPAFPCKEWDDYQEQWVFHNGMTLRDHFAGQALQGLLSSSPPNSALPEPKEAAALAYKYADAMIMARKK